jgi:hypothetical protein
MEAYLNSLMSKFNGTTESPAIFPEGIPIVDGCAGGPCKPNHAHIKATNCDSATNCNKRTNC